MKPISKWLRTRLPARLRLTLCLAAALTLWAGSAGAQIAVVDDRGMEIRLEKPAGRIIALYGALNEILAEMGLEDRIVARTQADDRPPSIVAKPSIGTHMRPNVELVLAHRPDVVIQMAGRKQAAESLAALERFGVKTALFRASGFEELYDVIRRLGILTGRPDSAADLINGMKGRIGRVRETIGSAKRPSVFFEVRYPNLLAAGGGSIVRDIVDAAGGHMVVAQPKKIVRLSEEKLLQLNPEVYLIQKGPMNPDPAPVEKRPHYRTLAATQSGRVHVVDEKEFSRPGPRNADAVEQLARLLHPKLF